MIFLAWNCIIRFVSTSSRDLVWWVFLQQMLPSTTLRHSPRIPPNPASRGRLPSQWAEAWRPRGPPAALNPNQFLQPKCFPYLGYRTVERSLPIDSSICSWVSILIYHLSLFHFWLWFHVLSIFVPFKPSFVSSPASSIHIYANILQHIAGSFLHGLGSYFVLCLGGVDGKTFIRWCCLCYPPILFDFWDDRVCSCNRLFICSAVPRQAPRSLVPSAELILHRQLWSNKRIYFAGILTRNWTNWFFCFQKLILSEVGKYYLLILYGDTSFIIHSDFLSLR